MPIYEFVCEACGTEFEQIQSFSDSSLPTCVSCHSTQVVRRMGRPAIHFKGSGWYITDSKKSNDKNGGSKSTTNGKSESASESKTESTTENKGDSKSETTTESKSETSSTPKSTPTPVASD